jgi:hypothetical protein
VKGSAIVIPFRLGLPIEHRCFIVGGEQYSPSHFVVGVENLPTPPNMIAFAGLHTRQPRKIWELIYLRHTATSNASNVACYILAAAEAATLYMYMAALVVVAYATGCQ